MIKLPLTLLIIHFVMDFICQSNWMVLNKSKWNQSLEGLKALSYHVLIYSLPFFIWGVWFGIITMLTHWITDALTSKVTSKLWFMEMEPITHQESKWDYVANLNPSKRHWFFVMIGFDQLIHAFTLGLTYYWLFGG